MIHAICVFGSVTVLFPQLPSVWNIGFPASPYWSKTARICVAFVTIEPQHETAGVQPGVPSSSGIGNGVMPWTPG